MNCGQACADSCSAVSNTDSAKCREWAAAGECSKNPAFMLKDRGNTHMHTHVSFLYFDALLYKYSRLSRHFMSSEVDIFCLLKTILPFESAPNGQRQECANSCPSAKREMDECKQWARSGECDRNPEFMLQKCASICGHLKQAIGKG